MQPASINGHTDIVDSVHRSTGAFVEAQKEALWDILNVVGVASTCTLRMTNNCILHVPTATIHPAIL
jgi:hypothetical protein